MKLSEITLTGLGADGKSTMTLVPRGVNPTNGVASLAEKNAVPALERRVTVSVSQPTRNRKNYKVQIRLQNPEQCVSAQQCDPSIVRTGYADLTLTFSAYSTAGERALVRTELEKLLADPLLVDAIDNLNPAY